MSEDEIIYIDDDGNTEETESASSESTGSAFGGSEDDSSVTYSQPNQSFSNNQFGKKQNDNSSQNPLSNVAKNALNNKLGNKGNVPEALKKRQNNMPGTKANSNNSSNNNDNEQTQNSNAGTSVQQGNTNEGKSPVAQAADTVAKKGGSAAMQAAGVPKPLADFIANKFLSGKSIKFAIIGGVVAFFMQLIIILGIMYIMFFPILKGLEIIGDIKEGTSNFFDSAGNWLTGDGWCATEEECADTAEKKFYDKVESVSNRYPNIDMSIVLSSVLYRMNGNDLFGTGNSDYCETKYQNVEEIAKCQLEAGYDVEIDTYKDAKSNLSKVAKKLSKGKEEFDKYMIDTFIPNNYDAIVKSGKSAESILDDIYALASFFNDYKNVTANISSGGVCSYSVNGQDVSNIKVRLRTCSWDPNEQTTPINGELIDFEKYITGVVYAENSGGPMEALKAQAIAARSFALARAKNMGGSYGISLAQENGQWVLDIRNCTADQVYCDPDRGCWTDSNTAGDTVYSGYVEGKAWSKGPLPEDSEIRTAVKSVNGMALIDSSGNIVNAPYTNTEQISWNKKASEGKDYNEILLEQYPNVKSVMSNCSANLTGDWSTWKQYDSRWGSTKMGTSNYTVAEVGCLVTSISIQIARSGTQIHLPSGVTEFNPGTFIANNPGMFSSGTAIYNGGDSWKNSMAPGFVGAGRIDNICGTRQEKVNRIAEYINQGYYLVTRVKFDPHGQHWVAIIGTSGNEVQIVDPGWPTTELFSYYGGLGANSNCLSTYLYKRID